MPRRRTRVFRGVDASPGICVGPVHLPDRRRFQIPKLHIDEEQVAKEVERFYKAVDGSIAQLDALRKKLSHRKGKEPRAIIEAHLLMMKDEVLIDGTEKIIRSEAVNAEWALQKNVARIREVFDSLEDDYFRERRSDVEFVGQRIMLNLMGRKTSVELPADQRVVVVAHDLSPADTAGLDRKRVAGFVTEVGGKAAHTAIIARSMEIPAVVAAEGILKRVGSGDRVIVDGYRGEVVLHPSERAVDEALKRSRGLRDRVDELVEERTATARTLDGHRIRLAANLELAEEVSAAVKYGADAVGLYRTELLFMGRRPPSEGYQRRCYRMILKHMADKPVTIRTLDLGADKGLSFLRTEPEANPALGLRSIRLSLRHRNLFLTQLRALLRASVDGQLRLLFPMISCHRELREARSLLEEAREQLRAKGQPFSSDIKLGMMIEVPSAAFMSESFAREVDFFSIGTNDLIQYTLAVDRHNEHVAELFNPLHVSILRLLKHIVDSAHKHGITVSMCGEMAGDPLYLHILLGLGLDEISMNPPALPFSKHVIRNSRMRDARSLTRRVLQLNDSEIIRHEVQAWMSERFPDFFTPEGRADILGGL